MARIRSVHPDICASETLASLPAELERTFVRLWTHCDDEGRCQDRPKLIKAAIYPEHDDLTWERVDHELWELHRAGLIQRYAVHGMRYISVRSWSEYQHPQRPTASKYPSCTDSDPPLPPFEASASARGDVRESSMLEREKEREKEREIHTRDERQSTSLALVPTNGSSPPVTVPELDAFEAWWKLYPRKVAKQAAAKAWKTARAQLSADELTLGLTRSLEAWQTERRSPDKIPHASTWLNGRRWEDEPDRPPPPSEPKGYAGIRAALEQRGSA